MSDNTITDPLVPVDYKNDLNSREYESFINAESSIQDQFYGQGPAHPITTEEGAITDLDEYDKDQEVGFTNPNLHRRIDPQMPSEECQAAGEYLPREYNVGIYGLNSYRTDHKIVHLEESSEDEIP